METRLGARQRWRPPTVHRGSTHAPRLQRPVASEDEASACSELRLGCHPETSVIEPCHKADRQLKVRPYSTMVFGSISADVQAKTNPIPWSSSGITTARKIITNGQPRNDPTLRAELPPGRTRTRKGEVDSVSLFRVFRWIPWLISDPPGPRAVGIRWRSRPTLQHPRVTPVSRNPGRDRRQRSGAIPRGPEAGPSS